MAHARLRTHLPPSALPLACLRVRQPAAMAGMSHERRHAPVAVRLLALALGMGLVGTALAQYKVIAPDGSVTYTDRAPVDANAKVQAMRRDGSLAAAPAGTAATPATPASPATVPAGALPLELRALVTRFPVLLYTTDNDCGPCTLGRNLLLQRGIPFSERSVTNDDDIAALQRLTGARNVPALTVGGQALRGFQDLDWHATLDLAGYPRESRLPRGWQPAPATPLVARNTVVRPGNADALPLGGIAPGNASTLGNNAPQPAPAASAGIRF